VLVGDPYEEQMRESGRLIAERAGLDSWSVAFQSESQTGGKWLGPDILTELDDLNARGVERVLVAPIGFVSDHLEILWDLDVEARRRADELGIGFERMPSLNDDPAFINALAALVRQASGAPSRIGAR
jgi:ferrochelatase